jgi:predicted Zn-ribbon and HTH transcriptional regulator
MHRLLRSALAVLAGGLCGGLWLSPLLHGVRSAVGLPIAYPLQRIIEHTLPSNVGDPLVIAVWQVFVDGPPVIVVALLVNETLRRRYGPKTRCDETRCRKCGYILRGLREPRCPECGEHI